MWSDNPSPNPFPDEKGSLIRVLHKPYESIRTPNQHRTDSPYLEGRGLGGRSFDIGPFGY
jgi:hypothetical protein